MRTSDELRRGFSNHKLLRDLSAQYVVALDFQGHTFPDLLVLLAVDDGIFLIECELIPKTDLAAPRAIAALGTHHQVLRPLATLDLQLLVEAATGVPEASFAEMLRHWELPVHPLPRYLPPFAARARTDISNQAAAQTASRLLQSYQAALKTRPHAAWALASQERVAYSLQERTGRVLAFNTAKDHALASLEVLRHFKPRSLAQSAPFAIHEDLDAVLGLLPEALAAPLRVPHVASGLLDVVLDLGRRPWAWVAGARLFLVADETLLVTQADLDAIVARVGGFGSDNRAGLERQLHRISAIRNRTDDIIALTIRVGRYIEGNARLIADVLAAEDKSVLFLGEPGCGKTTIVREVSRQLAARHNVCIVDTSNEIAGDGNIPHPCAAVMVQVVQNHTPEVMVIDEIGRANEVEAARTCKQRGVRIVASAHGDLRKLLKNKPLRGLVGGVQSVTVSDATAKEQQKGDGPMRKLIAERGGAPIFEVIVELRRGEYDSWRVVVDAAAAVDAVLAGDSYTAQVRSRTADDNAFRWHTEQL
ncbi:hypothetical protein ACHHYP_08486 [Achlya hypogyna]|uniref:AAA+ ATPase domain-containing protein n=1 Tax=Achlya hypogyna TaxID=1202772 RepID=A0A1V9YPK0_ACHHY|nr:hypothetical protein ACHHYP_08486 [Achlya hypogyna]